MKMGCRLGGLRNNIYSRNNPKRRHSLIEYANGVARARRELKDADQQETAEVTLCHQETTLGVSHSPKYQTWFNHSLPALGRLLHKAMKNLMPVVKNHTVLEARIASVDKIIV